jgi:hypothetical protein
MFTKTALVSLLAGLAIAAPATNSPAESSPEAGFTFISIHSGDINVHLHAVDATGGEFWIGKPTMASCPASAGYLCTGCKFLHIPTQKSTNHKSQPKI